MLNALTVIELGGRDVAIQAAQNFRSLRNLGVTIFQAGAKSFDLQTTSADCLVVV